MPKLENWSVTFRGDRYTAPELRPPCLQGVVADGPRAGKSVITSRIVAADGRVVETWSGSKYVLGKIDPKYRAWLREHRPDWDFRNPIDAPKVRQ